MNRYIVDSVSNGTIVYFIIRDTSNNSIVPLPTKYLKYKKNLGRKKKTLKNLALKLTWYLNYIEDNKLTVNKVLELSAFEQQEHFTSYLHFIRAGRHTTSGKCPDNNTANDYLRSIFDFYDFVILEYDNGTALKVLRDSTFVYTNSIGLRYAKTVKTFHGYLPREEHHAKSITEDDLHTLISSARTKRDKLLLLLLEETGFRIGEILGSKYTTDIDFENKKVFVRYRETNPNGAYAKYAEERGARISNSTFDLLMIYLTDTTELRKNTDYLFVSESGPSKGKPLTLSVVNSLFERLEKRCGISVHSHMLRHYFANERRKAGWDMAQISTSLGHKNIATTEAYLNVEDDELAEANDNYFVESMKFVDINDFL